MKWALMLSIGLNLLLAGWLIGRSWGVPRMPRGRAISTELSHRELRAKLQNPLPLPVADESSGAVSEGDTPFTWAQLESTHYHTYVANLRSIGCPESTVRDIIEADVDDLFTVRVKALVDGVTGRFWDLILRPPELEKAVTEASNQLTEWEQEREALFRELFGDAIPHSAEQRENAERARREGWERLADFLPEEKRARYVAANDDAERAWAEHVQTADIPGGELPAKRREFDAAQQSALGEWLTPEELGELRLRTSSGTRQHDRLVGLDLSETEARQVAQLQVAVDEARAKQDATTEHAQEAALRELLGAERQEAYRRATDERFGPLHRVAQRLELPDTAATQAYVIRLQAENTARQMRASADLPAEERRTRLQALDAETRQRLTTTLGEQGMSAYEKLDGDWLRQFQVPKP